MGSQGARVPKALQTWPVSCSTPYRPARRRIAKQLEQSAQGNRAAPGRAAKPVPIRPGPARVSPATRCRPRRLPMAGFTVLRVCSMSPRGPEREAGGAARGGTPGARGRSEPGAPNVRGVRARPEQGRAGRVERERRAQFRHPAGSFGASPVPPLDFRIFCFGDCSWLFTQESVLEVVSWGVTRLGLGRVQKQAPFLPTVLSSPCIP